MIKTAIAGCAGRMGTVLLQRSTVFANDIKIIGGTVNNNKPIVDIDLYNISEILEISDAVIDFSSPKYSLEIAQICVNLGKAHVCGTTGLTSQDINQLEQYAKKTKIFYAPNTSQVIHLLKLMVKKAAGVLDEEFDIEILDMHHRNKVDSPSGTALMLGKSAAEGRNIDFKKNAKFERHGLVDKRKVNEIGFATLKGGNLALDHTVIFAGDNECLKLSHTASNRFVYADGAYKALKWLVNQQEGKLYTMDDIYSDAA